MGKPTSTGIKEVGEMALPIGTTPILRGEEAAKFLVRLHEDAQKPVHLTPTPNLRKARRLAKEYAKQRQKQLC